MSGLDGFWRHIEHQLIQLATADTADDVMRILDSPEDGAAHAFFAGGGGDDLPDEPLLHNGWTFVWREAPYYWCMKAHNGDLITYVEGDVYRGDQGVQ